MFADGLLPELVGLFLLPGAFELITDLITASTFEQNAQEGVGESLHNARLVDTVRMTGILNVEIALFIQLQHQFRQLGGMVVK